MTDMNNFVEAIKKAAHDEREASKPMQVYFGKVSSTSPLQINVEQKMILGEAQLILTRNVTDYITAASIQWTTETAAPQHVHEITGQKNFLIHNALKVGEEVLIIRQQEGQKFIVVDRIGGKA